MKKITKAIIATAGFGTRFLPITKTIQKEMLPILDRPIVDYIVEDCVKAGITEIIFVINEHNLQTLHFYRENNRLKEYLDKMGKPERYDEVRHLHEQATFHFVKQKESDQYGTAVPLKLAKNHVENEDAFLVLMGDDFIYNSNGESEIKKMIDLYNESNAEGLVTCIEKPDEILHKYGVASIAKNNGYSFLKDIIEKPERGSAPSNLINISKYIFSKKVFEILENQVEDQRIGELLITDTATSLANEKPVVVYIPTGKYLDCGYPLGWLMANLTVAKNDPVLVTELQSFLENEFKK
jgi:UTP--glucose-1-phosphate uridylyltransferase